MVVPYQTNCLSLFENEMDIVNILNTKYKVWQLKEIPIVQLIV